MGTLEIVEARGDYYLCGRDYGAQPNTISCGG
jgi:hypothetical protein